MTLDEKRIKIAESRGWKLMDRDSDWWIHPEGNASGQQGISDYFHDPAAAVTLCEAMAKDGFYPVVTWHHQGKTIVVSMTKKDGPFIDAQADTFPAAVAECYGKAKGLWE